MDGIGRAFDGLISVLIICGVLAPFGVWKLVEIIVWLINHVRIV